MALFLSKSSFKKYSGWYIFILNATFTNNSFTIQKYLHWGPKLSKLWVGQKYSKKRPKWLKLCPIVLHLGPLRDPKSLKWFSGRWVFSQWFHMESPRSSPFKSTYQPALAYCESWYVKYKNSETSQQKLRKCVFRPFLKRHKKVISFTFSNHAKILWVF